MPRSKAESEARREETRRKILEAALRLFGRNGLAGTKITDITREAGISTGLIYHYFQNKTEILDGIIDHASTLSDEFHRRVQTFAHSAEQRENPGRILIETIRTSFQMLKEHGAYLRLYFLVLLQEEIQEANPDRIGELFRFHLEIYERVFTAMGSSDPRREARVLDCAIHGAMLNFFVTPSEFDPTEIEAGLIDLYSRRQ